MNSKNIPLWKKWPNIYIYIYKNPHPAAFSIFQHLSASFSIFRHPQDLGFGRFGAVSAGNEAAIDPAPQHLVGVVILAAGLGRGLTGLDRAAKIRLKREAKPSRYPMGWYTIDENGSGTSITIVTITSNYIAMTINILLTTSIFYNHQLWVKMSECGSLKSISPWCFLRSLSSEALKCTGWLIAFP